MNSQRVCQFMIATLAIVTGQTHDHSSRTFRRLLEAYPEVRPNNWANFKLEETLAEHILEQQRNKKEKYFKQRKKSRSKSRQRSVTELFSLWETFQNNQNGKFEN